MIHKYYMNARTDALTLGPGLPGLPSLPRDPLAPCNSAVNY